MSSPARLGILLSGSGSTYANLVDAINAQKLDAEVVLVIASKAGVGGLTKAAAFGHASAIAVEPAAVTAALLAARVEVVAMCGWLRFWHPPAKLAGRVVNIHPSLLPAFGGKGMYGLHVHRAVLHARAPVSGCTAHLVSGDYDSGPVLEQMTVAVQLGDTPETLQARVQAAEREVYPRVVQSLIERLRAPP